MFWLNSTPLDRTHIITTHTDLTILFSQNRNVWEHHLYSLSLFVSKVNAKNNWKVFFFSVLFCLSEFSVCLTPTTLSHRHCHVCDLLKDTDPTGATNETRTIEFSFSFWCNATWLVILTTYWLPRGIPHHHHLSNTLYLN